METIGSTNKLSYKALGLGSLSTHLQTIGWYNDIKIVSLIFARDSFERERERDLGVFGLLEIAFVPLLSLYFLNETFISSLSMNVGNLRFTYILVFIMYMFVEVFFSLLLLANWYESWMGVLLHNIHHSSGLCWQLVVIGFDWRMIL